MRKHFFCFLLSTASFFVTKSFAQNVAINEDGSAANPNAILDVKSFTKGVLLPRTSTTARLAMPNVKGMLVFDSTAGSFFYNTGTGWQNMTPPPSSPGAAWLLNGNSGTDSSSFLGTTDNKPLIIKVNNQPAGRIDAQNPNNNTAWGLNAIQSITSGSSNTAVGASALKTNQTGHFNTAVGANSMALAKGQDNTAIGAFTLQNNTTGFYNMAFGGGALQRNTTGLGNIAIGFESLFNDSTGRQNIAIGTFTLLANNGTFNTAVGDAALANNTTGGSNVVLGAQSLKNNTTGNSNIAIGSQSMNTNTIGSQNTVVGSSANVSANNFINATAIGANAVVNASNKVRIGNSAVTVIEGQVPFTTPSDGRFKYQVKEDVKGLDFIMQLRPVTYQFDVKRFDDKIRGNANSSGNEPMSGVMQASYNEAAAIRRTGFIAQEVEKAANATGYNFSGIIKPKTNEDHYSLSYESFVVPLVKAMQEQQQVIADMQKQIAELKQQLQHSK